MAAEAEALPVAAGTVEYVVQMRVRARPEGWDGQAVEMWRDMATVKVPPRTKRRTVVEKALAQASEFRIDADDGLQVRVLGPEDARPFKVSAVPRDPELRIEGV